MPGLGPFRSGSKNNYVRFICNRMDIWAIIAKPA